MGNSIAASIHYLQSRTSHLSRKMFMLELATNTKLCYLEAKTIYLENQRAQPTVNNQKGIERPRHHIQGHQQMRTRPTPMRAPQQRRTRPPPTAGAETPHNVPNGHAPVTWKSIKALNTRAEKILNETRVEDTPENRFLAYLAILSAKSTRALLLIAIIFCLGGQGLATKDNASYIYWGHIINPPVFKMHT